MEQARRFLVLAVLLGAVIVAAGVEPSPAWAAQYCSATCATATLQCNVSGTCSSSTGTVTCCGQTLTCAAIDAYNNCKDACFDEYEECRSACPSKYSPCFSDCFDARRDCDASCGTKPVTSLTC